MVQFAVSNIVSRLIVVRQLILIRMEAYSRENGGGRGEERKASMCKRSLLRLPRLF